MTEGGLDAEESPPSLVDRVVLQSTLRPKVKVARLATAGTHARRQLLLLISAAQQPNLRRDEN